MVRVTFVEPDGTARTIENAQPGKSLMEIAKANGIEGIYADCGGGCACATCHVYVDPEWMAAVGQPDEIETATLDLAADVLKPNSRLSCQIVVRPELEGLRVTVAPSPF
jgi:ferredoxin, 2Fe-2S